VVDFKNTGLIMTFQISVRVKYRPAAENPLVDRDTRKDVLPGSPRSFSNRSSSSYRRHCRFEQLSKKEIAQIIDVQLEKLRKNLDERGIALDSTIRLAS